VLCRPPLIHSIYYQVKLDSKNKTIPIHNITVTINRTDDTRIGSAIIYRQVAKMVTSFCFLAAWFLRPGGFSTFSVEINKMQRKKINEGTKG